MMNVEARFSVWATYERKIEGDTDSEYETRCESVVPETRARAEAHAIDLVTRCHNATVVMYEQTVGPDRVVAWVEWTQDGARVTLAN